MNIDTRPLSERFGKVKQEEDYTKEVFTIFGSKGEGKTTLSLSFPGVIACLSFDRKTIQIKVNMYNSDKRIKVYDSVKLWSEDPDKILESSYETYMYNLYILDKLRELGDKRPDWVLIDGLEILSRIAEFCMRFKEGLKPFQGIANRNVWKHRRLFLRNIHKSAMDAAKQGVIYTTYSDEDVIIKDGDIISKKKVPKWTDVVLYETDYVIQTDTNQEKDKKRFLARVLTSKNDKKLKTGSVVDVTDKPLPLGNTK